MKAKITAALLTIFLSMSSWAQMISQTDDTGGMVSSANIGQRFIATSSSQITRISVRPLTVFNGNLLIYNGGFGSGTAGFAGTPAYSQAGVSLAASSSGGPMRDIVLTTPFPVTAGNTYTFVLEGPGRLYLSSTPYADGQQIYNYATTSIIGFNLVFQVWSLVAATTAASIPTLSEWGVLTLSLLLGLFAVAKGYSGKGWRR